MTRYGMVLDLNTCTGCRACQAACALENKTPFWSDKYRTHVEDVTHGEFPQVERVLLPHLCMQCENPACAEACPTGATYQTADGLVLVDPEQCIDCRYCIAACPYNARFPYTAAEIARAQTVFDGAPTREHVDKCTFCEQRLKAGLEPACVATCLAGARIFGDLDDPTSQVAQLVASGQAKPVAPEAGTKPKVFYVASNVKAIADLPVNASVASMTNIWQGGQVLGSLGLGAAAVVGVGAFAFARKNANAHFAEVAAAGEPAAAVPIKAEPAGAAAPAPQKNEKP
jgi:Fe-S-cluster-containing dehydrogenase component